MRGGLRSVLEHFAAVQTPQETQEFLDALNDSATTSRPQLQHFIADSPKALISGPLAPTASKAKNVFHHIKIRILFALALD